MNLSFPLHFNPVVILYEALYLTANITSENDDFIHLKYKLCSYHHTDKYCKLCLFSCIHVEHRQYL